MAPLDRCFGCDAMQSSAEIRIDCYVYVRMKHVQFRLMYFGRFKPIKSDGFMEKFYFLTWLYHNQKPFVESVQIGVRKKHFRAVYEYFFFISESSFFCYSLLWKLASVRAKDTEDHKRSYPNAGEEPCFRYFLRFNGRIVVEQAEVFFSIIFIRFFSIWYQNGHVRFRKNVRKNLTLCEEMLWNSSEDIYPNANIHSLIASLYSLPQMSVRTFRRKPSPNG